MRDSVGLGTSSVKVDTDSKAKSGKLSTFSKATQSVRGKSTTNDLANEIIDVLFNDPTD